MLPALYAFLAYSLIYTIYVMTTADLVMRQVEPELAIPAVPRPPPHMRTGGGESDRKPLSGRFAYAGEPGLSYYRRIVLVYHCPKMGHRADCC